MAITAPKTVKLNKNVLASSLTDALNAALTAEKPLAANAQAQLTQLAKELEPIAAQELVALVTSTDPTVQKQYLAGLAGIIAARAASIGLDASYQQPIIIANVLEKWGTDFAAAISNPTVKILLQAAVAAIPLVI